LARTGHDKGTKALVASDSIDRSCQFQHQGRVEDVQPELIIDRNSSDGPAIAFFDGQLN